MRYSWRTTIGDKVGNKQTHLSMAGLLDTLQGRVCLCLLLAMSGVAKAQVNVVTEHNDIARTSQNLQETVLTPSNVNPTQFGELFSQKVSGVIHAQPLYVSQVTIPGEGVHNVVYVATNYDYVYAFDGNDNGGIDANPLWQVSLLTNTAPAGTYTYNFGVFGTPVIDLSSNTMYLVSSENQGSTAIYRLHALDITTGAEKLGGPVLIQASIPGTGSGSASGVLAFAPAYQHQRPGLLLLNGVLYIAFGSVNDIGPWHGWLFSYNAATLAQIDVLCTSANGSGAGIWMGGAGLAAEVNNPAQPFGRMFFATGNGSYTATTPYSNTMSYGMSVLDLDLSGGAMTVEDEFTPYGWQLFDAQDADLGSGGPVLLPAQTTASGGALSPLVQTGKTGAIYILDRNNLGGLNATSNQIVQEVQTPIPNSSQGWGAGIWGAPAYWNNNIYEGGTDTSASSGLTAYSFVNGVLSATPASQTAEQFSYPGPSPSVSANGATNAILWVLDHDPQNLSSGLLLAYDATNLANLLYSSNANFSRDDPGTSVEFVVPTIANGRVYADAQGQLSVFGLLGSTLTVAPPVISPPGATFTGSQSVAITDATPGAQIFYTTDGSTPTVNSTLYNSSTGIAVTSNETITAIASATGYLQGAPVSAVFSSTANAANPVFSLAGGSYSGPQTLTITDSSNNPTIYYTVDGTTPTTASPLYGGAITVGVGETVQAFATAPGLLPSSIVSATYAINPVYTIDFTQGFAEAQALGLMQFNGSTDLDDFRLQLTDGEQNEKGSAFYTQKVNVQSFTTDFTFQLSNPAGEGITFTIQNQLLHALGAREAGLGYQFITPSVAIKFDIDSYIPGAGPNSTGLYIDGVEPTTPSIDLTGTGIDLTNGDYFDAHITYDGTNLALTITDEVTLATWSTSWAIDIPAVVGGNTAWVGFTGSTGLRTSSQKLTSWTYLAGPPALPSYPNGFDGTGLALNGGAAVVGTALQMTSGGENQTTSAYYGTPVDIETFTADFDITLTTASNLVPGEGITFVIQNAGATALGGGGAGLGYSGIPNSVAIKFDIFNDVGEGSDSTGLYEDGAMPTLPSTNLTGAVSLGSGDLIHAHVTYDGTTLTWYLSDLTTSTPGQRASDHMTINIPHKIGSNTAYIGFTGASGSETTIQNILNWTFSNNP